jgi:3'(2'), 5'-bisphosphate nucleotidase
VSSQRDLATLVELARRAAHCAGAAILEVYGEDLPVELKRDASPVTRADRLAETLILAALEAAAPAIPVIAEERVEADGVPAAVPHCFWLVDPLDGTKEFIRRNGEFTVNIGLIEAGRPILGVVHVPALGLTFAGAGPGTATRQAGTASPEPIAARPVPARAPVVVHSRSHSDEGELAAYLATLVVPERRISGSAVKFCLLAAGEADLYPRFGPTMEWDTAAGQAVLEAAGGAVTTLDGAPFRYGKPGFRNPGFMASGRP